MFDEKPEANKPRTPRKLAIRNTMKAGKLFTSAGVLKPGQVAEIPRKEAKAFLEAGKATLVID